MSSKFAAAPLLSRFWSDIFLLMKSYRLPIERDSSCLDIWENLQFLGASEKIRWVGWVEKNDSSTCSCKAICYIHRIPLWGAVRCRLTSRCIIDHTLSWSCSNKSITSRGDMFWMCRQSHVPSVAIFTYNGDRMAGQSAQRQAKFNLK